MPNCAIANCKNTTTHTGRRLNTDVSFHRFPRDPNLKEKWIDATGNKDWFPTKFSTICSIHFDEDSFVEGKKLRLLIKTAIPTIDIVRTATNEEITDPKLSPKKASLQPGSRLLEKDINKASTSLENTSKEKLISKLNRAQQKIQEQTKQIKRLREQNRRKVKKIAKLMTVLDCLKRKSFSEQANSLQTINVTTVGSDTKTEN